jgi:SH3-like domain-containing protein
MPRPQHLYIAPTGTISALARIIVLIATFLLTLSGNAIAESNTYNQALNAYNSKDYETALPLWRKLATEGNADAQYALGVAYFKGEGVSRDLNDSMKWFEQAANSGNVQAMFNLGAAYWEGNGTRQSYAEAVEWWEKSAAAGQPAAQYNLGLAYYLGKGAEQDLDQALKWIRKAADNEHGGAQTVLEVIEKETIQNETRETETAQFQETDNQIESQQTPAPEQVGFTESQQTPAPEQVGSTEFQSAVVAGHGGQAYPSQDKKEVVLANLAGGTPIKILALKGDWAKINVPGVAIVWVYGKYVINQNGAARIRGTRVRARSLPSTGEDSVVLGIFKSNESVVLLTEREQWKQVIAPSRMALWMPIQQLQLFPNLTTTWLAQWQQALSGPTERFVDERTVTPDKHLTAEEAGNRNDPPIQLADPVSSATPFQPAFVRVSSAEILGADQSDGELLKLLLQGTPIKIIGQRQQWARVQIPGSLNVWVHSRYVNQQGNVANIQGKQVRARSMPSTTGSSTILGLFEENTLVTVISKQGDWIRVGVRDVVAAWMQVRQLEILDQVSDDWRKRWTAAHSIP